MDGAPHPATALAPGQAFTAGHDVPAQCFAPELRLEVEVEQVERGIFHLPGKVADDLATQQYEEVVDIVVNVLLNGVGALQGVHQRVQLLGGVIALVHLVPELAGEVGSGVDIFGFCHKFVIGFHSSPLLSVGSGGPVGLSALYCTTVCGKFQTKRLLRLCGCSSLACLSGHPDGVCFTAQPYSCDEWSCSSQLLPSG